MKRILNKLLLFAAALFLTAGCTDKIPSPDHFVGVIKAGFTRTAYTPDGYTLKGSWNAGDRIAVRNESGGTAVCLKAASGAAETDFNAESSSAQPEAPYLAFYPAALAEGSLPEIQYYSASGPLEVPMAAKSPTRYLEFRPICGLLEIKLASEIGDISLDELRLTSSQPLCGQFSLEDYFTAKASGGNELILDCGDGVTVGNSPVSLWISVPAGKYKSLGIGLRTGDGRTGEFTLAEDAIVDIVRAEITTCNVKVTSLTSHDVPEAAWLPNGLNFSRFIKCATRPEADWTRITGADEDHLITSIKFVTGSGLTSNLRIDDGGDAPIYVLFDKGTGATTVATAAKQYRMHEYCAYMFRNLYSLKSVDFGNMTAPWIVNMTYMFYNCEKLKTLDLSFMNTEATYRTGYAFANCKSLESINLSSFNTEKVNNMTYMFAYCSSLEKLDIRNFSLKSMTAASFNYGLHALASLRELWVGKDFYPMDGQRPSSFFVNSNTVQANRPGSKGGLTIHTVQSVADWLATTNLRWVHSGNKGQQPTDVKFLDIDTGNELKVTWAAN